MHTAKEAAGSKSISRADLGAGSCSPQHGHDRADPAEAGPPGPRPVSTHCPHLGPQAQACVSGVSEQWPHQDPKARPLPVRGTQHGDHPQTFSEVLGIGGAGMGLVTLLQSVEGHAAIYLPFLAGCCPAQSVARSHASVSLCGQGCVGFRMTLAEGLARLGLRGACVCAS